MLFIFVFLSCFFPMEGPCGKGEGHAGRGRSTCGGGGARDLSPRESLSPTPTSCPALALGQGARTVRSTQSRAWNQQPPRDREWDEPLALWLAAKLSGSSSALAVLGMRGTGGSEHLSLPARFKIFLTETSPSCSQGQLLHQLHTRSGHSPPPHPQCGPLP